VVLKLIYSAGVLQHILNKL